MFFKFQPLYFISFIFICLITFSTSCEEESEINTKEISKEVKKRKIKKVSPSDLLSLAEIKGANTVESLEKNWKEALKEGLEVKGKEYAKKFCIVPFIPGFDTISKNCTSIKKLGNNLNIAKKADSLEKIILEAYNYNQENNIPLTSNIQREGEKFILYSSPIFYDDASCTNCHSSQNPKENLQKKYVGFWSVKFSKKLLLESN